MTELKIDNGGWVVVCDGAKALVLENSGNRMHPNLRMRQVFEQPGLSDRELSADKPGRAFNSIGSAPTTSARPPVFIIGYTSEATARTRKDLMRQACQSSAG